jgi:hypothetical protein
MVELLSEKIEVERDPAYPRPLSFKWRGEAYAVAEVLREWVDTGFGSVAPERSRKWYNRHHRRYFHVRCSSGDVFEMYMDYADKRTHTWWLTRKLEQGAPVPHQP